MPPRLIFVFLVEMGFHRVGQAGLELLTSGDPPASASQNAGITGVSDDTWPVKVFYSFFPCSVILSSREWSVNGVTQCASIWVLPFHQHASLGVLPAVPLRHQQVLRGVEVHSV